MVWVLNDHTATYRCAVSARCVGYINSSRRSRSTAKKNPCKLESTAWQGRAPPHQMQRERVGPDTIRLAHLQILLI